MKVELSIPEQQEEQTVLNSGSFGKPAPLVEGAERNRGGAQNRKM